jgi:FkbM family methyltransferase
MSGSIPPINFAKLGKIYLRHLLGRDAQLILDIGANDGSDTFRFVSLFPNATVYAFEPDPRAAAKFKSRGPHPRVWLFQIAIGAVDGEADFYVSSGLPPASPEIMSRLKSNYPQGWDYSGSLRAPKNATAIYPWLKFESKIKVPVRSLDSWASERGIKKIDFIWADMQGAEGDLVAGGRETLARTRYLYTEYSDQEEYEGQPTLPQLSAMLPNFSILRRYQFDVFFENKAITRD